MALKDTWKDKKNGIDDADANDLNDIAKAVIEIEENLETANLEAPKIVEMTEEEFSSAVKDEDTYYLVY